jgi:hypothetical protein
MLNALDVPVMRPNVAVFGQRVWTRLRNHPRVVSAVFGSNQSGALVTRQMMAEVLELQAVYVGAGFVNTAKAGQTPTLSRVWGNHASFLYRDRAAGPQAGTTFGFTAERQGIQIGTIADDKRGVNGGVTVRALERVKEVTCTARWLSKAAEAALAVRAFQQGELDFEKALQEAQRLDALGLLADAVGQAQALESAVLKLHTSWRRLGGLQERLWVESGSSTPHLRELLTALQSLSGSTLRVSLGELAGGKRVRLQLVEESPEQLPPPPMP